MYYVLHYVLYHGGQAPFHFKDLLPLGYYLLLILRKIPPAILLRRKKNCGHFHKALLDKLLEKTFLSMIFHSTWPNQQKKIVTSGKKTQQIESVLSHHSKDTTLHASIFSNISNFHPYSSPLLFQLF